MSASLLPLFILTPVMLVLALGIVVFVVRYQKRLLAHQEQVRVLQEVKQLQLLEAVIEAQETERRRLAQDLHDEVGGMLVLAKLQLTQVLPSGTLHEGSVAASENVKNTLEEVISSVRRISHDLMPVILEKMGLWHALEALRRAVPKDANLEITLGIETDIKRLQPNQELLLYRIIQELFSNTIKHALADKIEITARQIGNKISLVYQDNGLGFNYSQLQKSKNIAVGIGLMNLQSRVALLNGELNFFSEPGAGTKAEIIVPILQ